MTAVTPPAGWGAGRIAATIALLLVIAFAAVIRVRLADVPLERDEGEYAYAGQLLLQGVPPYALAYNMKFPGTYFAYAAILAVFGESTRGIHLGLLLLNAATTVLVYLLGRRLFGEFAGAVAGCVFAILSLDRMIMGVFAHATHFVILPLVAGLLLLLRAIDSRRAASYFASGVLFGLATLMKQHALFFVPLGIALAFEAEFRRASRVWRTALKQSAWVLAGAATPFVLLVAVFVKVGVLGRFWFWTFHYAREYVAQVPLSSAPLAFVAGFARVTVTNWPIWTLALAGACALAVRREEPAARLTVFGLLAAALASVCPGLFFRPHYFIVLLPAAALLAGVAADSALRALSAALSRGTATLLTAALCVAPLAAYVVGERAYLFQWSPTQLSRLRYGFNPFIEAVHVARYIRERTRPGDRIAVFGAEPEIYFYAGRRSASGYIYTYPLLEAQRFASTMQDEFMRDVEAAHPAYLVVARIDTSFKSGPLSDPRLMRWARKYWRECYDLVGIADIYSMETTDFVWDDDVATYVPKSDNLLLTFRRKSEAPCVASP